jgi:hypothetical protein
MSHPQLDNLVRIGQLKPNRPQWTNYKVWYVQVFVDWTMRLVRN